VGENRKQKTQGGHGGTGAQTRPRRGPLAKRNNICNFLEGMWLHLGVTVEVDQQRKAAPVHDRTSTPKRPLLKCAPTRTAQAANEKTRMPKRPLLSHRAQFAKLLAN